MYWNLFYRPSLTDYKACCCTVLYTLTNITKQQGQMPLITPVKIQSYFDKINWIIDIYSSIQGSRI